MTVSNTSHIQQFELFASKGKCKDIIVSRIQFENQDIPYDFKWDDFKFILGEDEATLKMVYDVVLPEDQEKYEALKTKYNGRDLQAEPIEFNITLVPLSSVLGAYGVGNEYVYDDFEVVKAVLDKAKLGSITYQVEDKDTETEFVKEISFSRNISDKSEIYEGIDSSGGYNTSKMPDSSYLMSVSSEDKIVFKKSTTPEAIIIPEIPNRELDMSLDYEAVSGLTPV